MSTVRNKFVCCLVLVILASTVLAYFGRPKPPRLELVSPRQELPEYSQHYPGDTKLADRVVKSYGLAMVLVQSPYTNSNVVALEAVRSWARNKFQQQPDFLHPVSLEPLSEPATTVFGALGYSLFTGPWYSIEQTIGDLLKDRIEQFHNTSAYASFNAAYFDLFGVDADAADLLAKYQTEKAKQSMPVVLWCLVWILAGFSAFVWVLWAKDRYGALQKVLAYGWLMLSISYLVNAWTDNQVSFLISSLLCAMAGLYLKYPFVVGADNGKGGARLKLVTIGSSAVSLMLWISISLLAIQILTWIRTGTPNNLDPVTLFLSAVSGNFLHDCADEKRLIVKLTGIFWLGISIWLLSKLSGTTKTVSHGDRLQ